MKKEEFLKELENRLSGLPKEDIDERVEFYSEMIDDRIEDGMTEAEAIAEIGTIDDVISQIALESKLVNLVSKKVKKNFKPSVLEIILLSLGFPLWFPLCLTALVLMIVAYVLMWVLVIVSYSVEIAFVAGSVSSLVMFFMSLGNDLPSLLFIGASICLAGLSVLFFFVCKSATILTIKVIKKVFLKIKKSIINRGGKKND